MLRALQLCASAQLSMCPSADGSCQACKGQLSQMLQSWLRYRTSAYSREWGWWLAGPVGVICPAAALHSCLISAGGIP